ncbi:hypothetical protein [Solicola sp. PLA-1-18]|uniref:hypothetical protein n=1 Tax=Solicola sp. PLA-1-18 TaxID=3380532 RepID=UPI003B7A8B00
MTAFALVVAGAVVSALAAPGLWVLGASAPRWARPIVALALTLLLAVAAVTTLVDGAATGTVGEVRAVPAVVLAAAGGVVVVAAVLDLLGAPPPPEPPAAEVLRGGTWIGVLERLAVFGSVAARWPEGIAVVVAVKGLGRYPELRGEPGMPRRLTAETFIVGTLVSLVWCAACAYVGLGPLRLTK